MVGAEFGCWRDLGVLLLGGLVGESAVLRWRLDVRWDVVVRSGWEWGGSLLEAGGTWRVYSEMDISLRGNVYGVCDCVE